ncbi:hypothetical protein GCM10009678_72940 [Actinomadura kijaniata]|uniref:Uncharacterized protein n=1 Tax=Actinomadura namibiensis TaxID=182080 RepID=A0A7W3M066_ACTNM|nr:hypothetical protein [Actinomadura namibiensis]MBA8957546.1 hypothetical protein [Actinomadura namibiensis]
MRTLLRHPLMAVLCLVGGLNLVAWGIAGAVLLAPGGDRDLRLYRAAARCPSAPSGPAECRWTQEFTVVGVRLTTSRYDPDSARLRDAGGSEQEVATDKDLLAGLDKGERVTGTVWRGRIVEISADGETRKTDAAPDDLRARFLIGALVIVPPGLLATLAAAWRLVRFRRPEPTPGMTVTLGLAFALGLIGILSPAFAAGREEDLSNTLVPWLIMTPIALVVALGYAAHLRSENAGPS